MENNNVCPGCQKKTMRSEEERKKLINRLKRVEGQIRGIIGMLENDAYCNDILIQSAAVNAAVNSFNKELLASHIRTCVARDIREGKDETIDEPEPEDGESINYELVAFEWVDANVMALNERCNEGIAQGLNDILLEPAELPNRESWPEICRELERNDMDGCQCEDGGIRISLTGKRSGR